MGRKNAMANPAHDAIRNTIAEKSNVEMIFGLTSKR